VLLSNAGDLGNHFIRLKGAGQGGRYVRIEHLYRYPVKGLSAEALEEADVEAGGAFPWDRAFALAQGDAPFDPVRPEWLKKTNFMCLMANAGIASLKSVFDPARGLLTIRAPDGAEIVACPLEASGRAMLAAWLGAYLGAEARGLPVFHHVPGHVFGDQRAPVVSLINLASIADLEAKLGAPRHKLRFRGNVYFSGLPALAELDWVGRELLVGGARLRVTKRTVRCPATQVNPETAERDANPVLELHRFYGHADLGIHAEVLGGGRIAMGDSVTLV
jgi:uncharacterized protein YcbX